MSLVKSEKTELMEKMAKMVAQVVMESMVAEEKLVQPDMTALLTLVKMVDVGKWAILA